MKKNRRYSSLAILLCVILMLSSVVFAESTNNDKISTGDTVGLTQVDLSCTPSKIDVIDKENSYQITSGATFTVSEYTITVPAGTEKVTLTFTSSEPSDGFFLETESNTLTMSDLTKRKNKDGALAQSQTEVTLTEGKGSTKFILPYIVSKRTNGVAKQWGVVGLAGSSRIFKFSFVEETASVKFSKELDESVTYQLNQTANALHVDVDAPETSNIQYKWYQGATSKTATNLIEGADTNDYVPTTNTAGVTYYRVEAIVTEDGEEPVVLNSTTKFIVKDPAVGFVLDTFCGKKLTHDADDDCLYTIKLDAETDREKLFVFQGALKGSIPDGVTIERVWSGSSADTLDLTQEGALKVDYDTNTFVLDLTAAQSVESAFQTQPHSIQMYKHMLGRCLYLQTDNGTEKTVYTIAVDSGSAGNQFWDNLPEMVELVDENGETLSGFTAQSQASDPRQTSIVRGTLDSDKPVVLRARVRNGSTKLIGQNIQRDLSISTWNESQQNWVLVNGQLVGGSFHGQTDVAEGLSLPFTLQHGLNVIEVYTNAEPYYLTNDTTSDRAGMHMTRTVSKNGANYTYKAVSTSSVIYLIDYQGTPATNVSQGDQTDTSLQEVVALRFGASKTLVAACDLSKSGNGYQLTLPDTFNTNQGVTTFYDEYTHAVLVTAKPNVPGAKAVFSGIDGLVVGESVADSAFLNMEALFGKESQFTITVTAADGTTQKSYPVKVVYASSATDPEITVTGGAKLDATFDKNTYTYYLDYHDRQSSNGYLNVQLPTGATATVNDGESFSGEKQITVNPQTDFYRLTITAADNATVTSYYFVTRYSDKTIPYATISDDSKKLAKEMLWKYYENLDGTQYFPNYWNIFMAKAATGYDESVPAFDFNEKYVKDPARHEMGQTTDWAACIMEIVMLGYDPYHFPRYVNGEYVEDFNYVEGFRNQAVGAYANSVWYQFAAKAIGDPVSMTTSMENAATVTYSDLDTRAWSIASLAGCVETKDMVRYVDSLHDSQITDGSYMSLWKNMNWGSAGGNTFTTGCVLQAIVASGGDPDKLFAYGGNTPLNTIKNVMFRDGYFYSRGSENQAGALPKDMIIGLGDILYGSSVWNRYALTAEKYDALIAKANTEGISTTDMPEFKEKDDESSRAYFKLYQQVADKLAAKDDYSMRPKVTFGMPYELFSDKVKAMPEASALTTNDLSKLETLIAEYDGLDDSNKNALASLNGNDESDYYGVLTKYQALVKRGLALKADGTTADTDKISKIYDEILALPAASEITESNIEATLTKVTEIEQEIGTLSEEEKALLTWMDSSLLQKLEDIKKAAPKPDITVTFTLLGDTHHTITDDSNIHSYRFNAGPVWVKETTVTVAEGSTVGDVFKQVLDKNGLKYTGLDNGYIDSITYTDNTTLTAKDDSRDKSGWLYLVQPKDGKATHPNVGLNAYELSDGDKIIWHWSDDYQIEQGSEHWSSSRVVDYVANLYDLAEMEQDAAAKAELQKKADAAYGVLGSEAELLPLQSQVETLRAVRKSVRDVTALIKEITDWTVPAGYSNERTDVVKWVQDKLNTELADQLDGVSVTASIGVYDITPSKPGVDGKFTATIYLSKEVTADSGDKLSSKNELTIKGVLKASAALSSDSSVSSVTVCNTPATASEDGNTYTVTVPYGSTVTAESFTITLSSDTASVTAGPAETEESGVWTFTVTAENGTTADYTVKVLVAADPAEGNKAAVDAAKAMLEKTSFIYASKDVNTEAAAKAAVERQIGALLRGTDISYEVAMTGFTAAVDGTLWSEPTNGSFSFTVKLTRGENDSYAEANVSLTGTITAASKPVTPPTPSKPTKPATKPTDEPAKPDASKFVDVSKNNWYFDAVQYVLENGLMNGTSANEFSPNANTTRGMIVTILARLDGVDTSGSSPWYAAGREWAMGAGVSDGTNMTGKITREQLAAMLYRYAKMKGYDVSAAADISGYADASSVSSWATDAMRWAVGAGLINGRTATTLAPQGNATRAEVAAILMRFAQKIVK